MSMFQSLMGWVDARFPATKMFEDHMSKYYAPKNFNFWYFFGSLAMLVLVNQLLTGIWLTMMYNPSGEGAFASVELNIMRDVEYGWLIRYLHSTGASAFFAVVYLHMFRRLHGLPAALGSDVILGCPGNHFPVWCHSLCGRCLDGVDPR